MGTKTRFQLSHKIVLKITHRQIAYDMLLWCYQNSDIFYSSFNFDDIDSLYDIEIISFENSNDALSFTLTFIGLE